MRLWSIIAIITKQQTMGKMHNPPHPGEVLKDGVFVDTGVTVTEAAKALGVTRAALSRVLNGRAAVSADMALRLAQWLNTGPGSLAQHAGRL